MISRRDALKALGTAALVPAAGLPGLSLAQAATGRRLVFVFLRGGLDGLSAVAAYGEPAYARARGELALPAPGGAGSALKLDGMFALHPQLAHVHSMYQAGECALLHAVASPYRERSHFDAQNVLENGTAKAHGRDAGWLNLALESVGATDSSSGIALANTVPLVLRGPASVGSWSPSGLPSADPNPLTRRAGPYRDDPLLDTALQSAQGTRSMAQSGSAGERPMGRNRGHAHAVAMVARAAGSFLSRLDGPRVATIDMGGWDMHANQAGEPGRLNRNLGQLDRGLAELKSALGQAWKQTAVLVVTEFGRAVAPNSLRGTDHGVASAAFVLGGAVRGGRVIADWPGLTASALHEGRDLKPTTDLRALFKAALIAQLRVPESVLETVIFPDSRPVRPIEGLFA